MPNIKTQFLTSIRSLGSLTFGIVLVVILLILLALGTFIESEYSSSVSQFFLYANPWFHFLVALLALNLVASALLRLPWKRRHIPFLVAHIGIVILLLGCYLTSEFGEEAQITLPEGAVSRIAIKPTQQQLEFEHIAHNAASTNETLRVPFRPGPFSWQDYERENWFFDARRYRTLLWYALSFVPRTTGQRGPIGFPDIDARFEVLDYHVHSAVESVPPFELGILWSRTVQGTPRNWETVSMDLRQRQPSMPGLSDVRGHSETMAQGERITYSLALSPEELTAFLASRPQGGAGLWGEIVLYYAGNHHSVFVNQLLELDENARFPVGNSGLQIGNVRFTDRGLIINFSVFTQSGEREAMTLFPFNPELNVQARRLGVFGSYWLDPQRVMQQSIAHADHPMLQRLGTTRIDFMQGPDQRLYYRLWSGRAIVADGIVPEQDGQRRPQFRVAANTTHEVEIAIDRFVPQDVPGGRIVPQRDNRAAGRGMHNDQRVKLRVIFDGNEDTFWLRVAAPTVVPLPPEQDQIRYVYGNGRTLAVQVNFETIYLGFGILLKQSVGRNEPGTRMLAHSMSLVDFVQPISPTPPNPIFSRNLDNYRTQTDGEGILISLNRPAFFAGTGRGYRIYQSSRIGPFFPDQPQFHELYDGTIFHWDSRPRESIALSTLSANHDPGRGWKYLGSFMTVLGAVIALRKSGERCAAQERQA